MTTNNKRRAAFWRFPSADFALYQQHCSDGFMPVKSYRDYLELLNEFAEEMGDGGFQVIESNISVESMLFALEEAGLANTGENRAAVVVGE